MTIIATQKICVQQLHPDLKTTDIFDSKVYFLLVALAVVRSAPMSIDKRAQGDAIKPNVPVHVPVNSCGDTVSVIGLVNPSFGNKRLEG